MHVMTLRRVSAKMTLPDVLAEMARAKQQAVIVSHDGVSLVVTVSDVTRAINDAVEEDIDPAAVAVGTVLPRNRPVAEASELDEQLGVEFDSDDDGGGGSWAPQPEEDQRFAIIEVRDSHGRVAAASKTFAASLGNQFTLCTCAGPEPKVHTFTPGELNTPGVCNYAHQAAVICGSAGSYT